MTFCLHAVPNLQSSHVILNTQENANCTDVFALSRTHRTDLQIPRYVSASLQAGNRWEENGKYGEEVLINIFAEPVGGAQVILEHIPCNDKLTFIILTTCISH